MLTACTKTPDQDFSSFKQELMKEVYSENSISLNLSFHDPVSLGIQSDLYRLDFEDEEDYKNYAKDVKEILKQLKSYKNLEDEELMDQKVLIAYFEDSLKRYDFYSFEVAESLSLYQGVIFNLPSYLEVYDFRDEKELESYFHFIETFPKDVKFYLDLEMKRQENNQGFGQEEIDRMLLQAQSLKDDIVKEDFFLKTLFKEKMATVSFDVSDQIITKHNQLMDESLALAYATIIDVLSQIDAEESTGLANKNHGKAYYNMLVNEYLGGTIKIKDYMQFLLKDYEKTMDTLFNFDMNYFDIYEKGEYYPSFDDKEAMLEFLFESIGKDFPSIESVNYEIRQVDISQAESAAPAYYFTPKIDAKQGDLQLIYFNQEYSDTLYDTMAHEAFPGHMYYFNYLGALKLDPLRYTLTSSSVIEGWANYAENYSMRYIADEDFNEFVQSYTHLIQVAHIILDLGVHYYGWDVIQLQDMMMDLGLIDQNVALEDMQETYLHFVMYPGNYVKYYGSSLEIEHIKASYLKQNPNKTDFDFHKEILDIGPSSLSVIKEVLNP